MERIPHLGALRAFEAAARHGSFVRAAAELHVTPAAVSHRIKELESAVGCRLFERLPRGVRLTEAGKRYGDEVGAALARIGRATESLGRPPVDGPLRVTAPQSFAQLWLVPRLHRLTERFPGLELEVRGDNRIADLRGGQADLAVRFGQGQYPGLNVRYLMGDAVSLVIAPGALGRIKDGGLAAILDESVLLEDAWVGPGEPWMTWNPWLRDVGVDARHARTRLRFSDSAMALMACHAQAGVCIGRLSLALEFLRRRELSALVPWRSAEFAHYLVTREADADNPRIAAFRNWIEAEVRACADEALRNTGFRLGLPRPT